MLKQPRFPWAVKCRGAVCAIDAFCWLHAAVNNCYEECVIGKSIAGAVSEVMERTNRFLVLSIRPLLVFDGRRLPGKRRTDDARARARTTAQAQVESMLDEQQREDLSNGLLSIDVDEKTMKAAACVTDELVTAVINELRKMGLAYVKAPFEADAQLAYLAKTGIAQWVISEDADMLVYGCPRVLLNVRYDTCTADAYVTDHMFTNSPVTRSVPLLKLLVRCGRELGRMALCVYAVVQGCDYEKFDGWGPARAIGAVSKLRKTDFGLPLPELAAKVVRAMHTTSAAIVPGDAAQRLLAGMQVYTSQVVYCVHAQRDLPLDLAVAHYEDTTGIPADLPPPLPHCGDVSTGTVDIDGVGQLSRAKAHALGFIQSRDVAETIVALEPVTQLVRSDKTVPIWLTADMVQGAELDPNGVTTESIEEGPKPGKPTKSMLELFLLTRNYDSLSALNWKELAQRAHDQLELEADMCKMCEGESERAPPPAVRSHQCAPCLRTCVCVHTSTRHIVTYRHGVLCALPQRPVTAEKEHEGASLEAPTRRQAPMQWLRDRAGGCALQYLLERNLVSVHDYPQGDESLTCPPATDPGWETEMNILINSAPGISEDTLLVRPS